MKIQYSLLRRELEDPYSIQCDSYKYEIHPVTGKFTLYFYEQRGAGTHLTGGASAVLWFEVDRTP
jgi:hypothetical protein